MQVKSMSVLCAPGGLGGVHREGEKTMDISADLTTAGKVPVLVVCAGVKTVLDIPRTLEFLETQGVCVCAYGADNFPAFFTPDSGCKAPVRVDTPQEAAGLIRAAVDLGLGSGVIVGEYLPIACLSSTFDKENNINDSVRSEVFLRPEVSFENG